MKHALMLAALLVAVPLVGQSSKVDRVGPTPDGGFLLNSGWRIQPPGSQILLDTLPMATVLTHDGKYLLVLNGGYNPPSISVIDTSAKHEISRTPVPDGWLGMVFSPNERLLWVGGGSKASIFEFAFSEKGELKATRTFPLVEGTPTPRDFIGDVTISPDGKLLYAADLYHDRVLVVDAQTGTVRAKYQTGRRPYRILFTQEGKSFFVTSWADGTLYQHQADNGYRMNALPLGAHPTDMVWSDRKRPVAAGEEAPAWDQRLFVAAANTNYIYSVGVSGTSVQMLETINIATTAMHPLGMTPSALALNAEQTRLYVVCSDANAAAVIDVEAPRSQVLGFVPTGWYPTAAKVLKDGSLVVLNGRGGGSHPNPQGPNPTKRATPSHQGSQANQYVGHLQTGSASVIPPFNDEKLAAYTRQVIDNSPYRDEQMEHVMIPRGNPIPANDDTASPIEHVIYILKENRTYDQVLGDIGKGESDPSLTLFGEKISPNHHKLARDFVLFDNFYVSADVSADGQNWSDAAIASDYVEKLWPNSYGKRRDFYDYEGGEPAALPAAGYLWTNAVARGISLHNYGHFVTNKPRNQAGEVQVAVVKDGTLEPLTNKGYRGFDLDYPDTDRVKVFLQDLKSFEETNNMPKLILMRLPNDHTFGTTPGKLTPLALMADNDYALGQLVEAVSHTKFWKTTAIFVLEDDAQNGPDHIDSHRSPVFVISPYTRRGSVDSTLYNTASVLRTIELIIGLRPMTQFDAAATPMWRAFANEAVLTPYDVEKPRVSLTERNSNAAGQEARLREMDFSEADLNDDDEMNEQIWRAIRGTDPPAPVRSFFGR